MSSINPYLVNWWRGPSIPDFAYISRATFLVDGVNANQRYTGFGNDTRIMGVYPHWQTITPTAEANPAATTDLAIGGNGYQYGMRWRVTDKDGSVHRSAFTFFTYRNVSGTLNQLRIPISDYEFKPGPDATWTVLAEIYRSKYGESNQLLYRLPGVTINENGGNFIDTVQRADLILSDTHDMSTGEENGFIPPVRCIRTWDQGLVGAGTTIYNTGRVSVRAHTAGRKKAIISDGGRVRKIDRWARLKIVGHSFIYTIVDVVLTDSNGNGYWVLDNNNAPNITKARFEMYRNDGVYIGKKLSLDPESYRFDYGVDLTATTGDHVVADDGQDRISALAVASGLCYVFYWRRIMLLEGNSGSWRLTPVRNGVGCASHCTVADRHSDRVFFYAGEHGIWVIENGNLQKVSSPIDDLIAQVDHSKDARAHGIYDPNLEMYHLWLFEQGSESTGTTNIPDFLITYDTRNGNWYPSWLPATSSAILNRAGRWVPCLSFVGSIGELTSRVRYDGANYKGTVTDNNFGTSTMSGGSGFSVYNPASTTPTGLIGLPLTIMDADYRVIQRRIIRSNTTTVLTVYGEFDYDFQDGVNYYYRVGYIPYYATFERVGFMNADFHKGFKELEAVYDYSGNEAEDNRVAIAMLNPVDGKEDRELSNTFDRDNILIRARHATVRARFVRIIISGVTRIINTIRELVITSQDTKK